MAKWITVAPNGNFVTVSIGSNMDATYKNGQVIQDVELAKRHPSIFVQIESDPVEKVKPEVQKPQILQEVTPPTVEEVVGEVVEPQILQEVTPPTVEEVPKKSFSKRKKSKSS